jgi:ferritin-like metal-binding protein YciE
VGGCLERLGRDSSALKTTMSSALAAMQQASVGGFDDELVRNALAGFAAESFEIASYRALIAAARHVGDEETARICEQIMRDEERMAEWYSQRLASTVDEVYQQRTAGHGHREIEQAS